MVEGGWSKSRLALMLRKEGKSFNGRERIEGNLGERRDCTGGEKQRASRKESER